MACALALLSSCSKKNGTGPEPEEGFPDHVVATIHVGRGPMDVAVTPDNAYVYVSNQLGSSISVIRASDNSVIDTISVGSLPAALCMHPNGDYLYVQDNISNNHLYIIRTSDNTVVDTISGAMSIGGFDITPNGEYLYLPVSTNDSVKVFRTADYFMTKVGVGDGPYDAAITPDGDFVYVCNVQDDAVSVIRISDNTVTNTIPVGLLPLAVVANPSGDYIYVANYSDISISVIGTSDNTVVANIAADNVRNICLTPNGKYLYAAVGGGVVDVFDTQTNEFETTIAVGLGATGICAAPNGEHVYVCNFADSTVSVIGK
jgi:YVTN family beta-propeller protein